MKGPFKSLFATIGSALSSAIGYELIGTKLKELNLLIVISIFTGVMSLLTAGILVLMRYYAPDLLHDVHAPTKEQWAYAIIVGVVFTAADVLLIMAARLGSIPGAIPMLAALTLVFTVVLDNIFNNTAIPLKTHYAIGIGIIVLAIFVIAGGDYLESLKK